MALPFSLEEEEGSSSLLSGRSKNFERTGADCSVVLTDDDDDDAEAEEEGSGRSMILDREGLSSWILGSVLSRFNPDRSGAVDDESEETMCEDNVETATATAAVVCTSVTDVDNEGVVAIGLEAWAGSTREPGLAGLLWPCVQISSLASQPP